MQEEMAKITSTMLGWEDHGIFTCFIMVDYDSGGSQGIGGRILDKARTDENGEVIRWPETEEYIPTREGTVHGLEFIMGIMQAVGVSRWEDLPGKHVIVLREGRNSWGADGIRGFGKKKAFMFEDWKDKHFEGKED